MENNEISKLLLSIYHKTKEVITKEELLALSYAIGDYNAGNIPE